jgi:phosphoserine phosphatase RsbU/P
MFRLRDFYHLPELDPLMQQVIQAGPGLVITAGLDPRGDLLAESTGTLLPSGRSFIFDILVQDYLETFPQARAIRLSPHKTVKPPRHLRKRLQVVHSQPGEVGSTGNGEDEYAAAIRREATRAPDLLVVDRLTPGSAPAVADALKRGQRVSVQLDTILRGAEVARQVAGMPDGETLLAGLTWVVAVRRMPTLCTKCRTPSVPTQEQIGRLCGLYPHLAPLAEPLASDPAAARLFFQPGSCEHCHAGRLGDIAVFDVFHLDRDLPNALLQQSQLSLEEYMLRLAAQGRLALADLLELEVDQLHRTYTLLATSEQSLADTNRKLSVKLAELEAANRVLEQRTEVLVALQDINHALITSAPLSELAGRVCKRAGKLCGAERVILYYQSQEAGGDTEVLAVSGWPANLIGKQVLTPIQPEPGGGLKPFTQRPPGVHERDPFKALAGLAVPLIAQGTQVGRMVVQTAAKARFSPGETSLLQTIADQAALAIQRAGLVDELRAKILQLEQAQVELVQKERLERELELARQVQQSVLPVTFPPAPGLQFSALNEPARQVGGDFYDVFVPGEGKLGLVIGDVSDKGMPAALFMALTRSLILAEARREASPRVVLENVNRLLQELGQPNQFVTVFYGVVDPATRLLTYSRAGHDRPVLLRHGKLQTLGGQGAVLGVLEDDELNLSEEQIELAPGDCLVMYTDGLTDVLSPAGEFFELPRLQQLLIDVAGLEAKELCQAVFDGLRDYQAGAEQFDDMTLLVMQVV